MKVCLMLAGLVILTGCTKPAFEFRGYKSNSSCEDVIEAELQLGGTIESESTLDLDIAGMVEVTRLAIDLFDHPAHVDVGCLDDSSVYWVVYIARTDTLDKQDQLYADYAERLDSLFGVGDEFVSGAVTTRDYVCSNRGGLTLASGTHTPSTPVGVVDILVGLGRDPCL